MKLGWHNDADDDVRMLKSFSSDLCLNKLFIVSRKQKDILGQQKFTDEGFIPLLMTFQSVFLQSQSRNIRQQF